MKIAVSSEGKEMTSGMDLRFGRARWFLVFDTETSQWEAHDNTVTADASHGAGPQTVKGLTDLGVETIITGSVGPKAHAALKAAKITAYQAGPMPVADAVQRLQEGDLNPIAGPDSAGWAVG